MELPSLSPKLDEDESLSSSLLPISTFSALLLALEWPCGPLSSW